ncbi:protein RALF-like 27 [Juglans microcarpa x Juglans regia]|uniref:protein RALF-like 27 n=1 Tax=Juglans microcarpa x Juglans regia TaxID=2249226 RepID=UPI001B7DC0D3|nr:protein RALF-like 27 [Juglans microcarpa x Juglans regia]
MGKESKRSLQLGVVILFFAVIPSMIESGIVPDHGRNTSTGCDASVGECGRELAEQLDDYQVYPEPEPEPYYYYYSSEYVAYRSLFQPPVCSGIRYGNCIVPVRGRTRACSTYDRCKRGITG